MDTIFAPATARGKAGLAVVRISGPDAWVGIGQLVGDLPPPHRAALRKIYDLQGGFLDEALVIAFPAGHSFTGEPTVELQLHGSVAIMNAVLQCLACVIGFRLAKAGEFTRRAMDNNRLDLTQVEGLADLIDAETEAQRRQAQKVLSGAVGALAAEWRCDLVRATALLEATIDFADEDLPTDVSPEVLSLIDRTLVSLKREQAGSATAERVRDNFEVAIVGPPNVGKSTLLNTLAGRDAAITSEIAGTTRDCIEVRMDLCGLPVVLIDTAGFRETDDVVEQIGVERGKSRAAQADLRVALVNNVGDPAVVDLRDDDIILLGKADVLSNEMFGVSGVTGQGIDRLIQMIVERLQRRVAGAGVLTRERQRIAVRGGIEALEAARIEIEGTACRSELAAEELRNAIAALDLLVGRIGVEEVLGEIFSSFCVGK